MRFSYEGLETGTCLSDLISQLEKGREPAEKGYGRTMTSTHVRSERGDKKKNKESDDSYAYSNATKKGGGGGSTEPGTKKTLGQLGDGDTCWKGQRSTKEWRKRVGSSEIHRKSTMDRLARGIA